MMSTLIVSVFIKGEIYRVHTDDVNRQRGRAETVHSTESLQVQSVQEHFLEKSSLVAMGILVVKRRERFLLKLEIAFTIHC